MEKVLDVYKRPYSRTYPVICMDESPKQLIGETRVPIKMRGGRVARYDYEYERCGICNLFMVNEPLLGKRYVKVTDRKTKQDWAELIREIADELYPRASKITLVMDNLATHKPGALYEAFAPEEAKRIWERFDFVYTPKHGSWLNMAETELSVLSGDCLDRRMDCAEFVASESKAWEADRNKREAKVRWRFTIEEARVKLEEVYPIIDSLAEKDPESGAKSDTPE
jgi:hypothetical protein